MGTKASLLQDGVKSGPFGMSYLQVRVASPVICPSADAVILADVTHPTERLGYLGTPLGSTDGTSVGVHILYGFHYHPSLLVKDQLHF